MSSNKNNECFRSKSGLHVYRSWEEGLFYDDFNLKRWLISIIATACELNFSVPGWQNFITRWALSVLSAYPVWAEETQSNLPKITFSNFRFSQKNVSNLINTSVLKTFEITFANIILNTIILICTVISNIIFSAAIVSEQE